MSSTSTLLKAAPVNGPFSMNSAEDLDILSKSPKRQVSHAPTTRPILPTLKFCDVDKSQEESPSDIEVFTDFSGEQSEAEAEVEDEAGHSGVEEQDYSEKLTSDTTQPREERRAQTKVREGRAEEERSSWTDLDLSMVVALVSPIGNWLTGGDHIKNLLLIALLIFYLHQLIQVPWELYRASRPRRPQAKHQASSEHDSRLLNLARTELRLHEFTYLALAVISPLIGAVFLRTVLSSLNGADPLSWFSTTLFVLSTGLRPWSHLVSRLRQRTLDLHDAVHYPSADSVAVADEKLQVVLARVEQLERELRHVRSRAAEVEGVEEVYDDLSGAVEDVERHVRRNHRKAEAARTAHENRLAVVEKSLGLLLEERRQNRHKTTFAQQRLHNQSLLSFIVSVIMSLPHKLWSLALLESPPTEYHPVKEKTTTRINYQQAATSPILTPTRLETILEDSDSDNEEDTVHDVSSVSIPLKPLGEKYISATPPAPRTPPSAFSRVLINYTAAAVTWPYRMSVKLLTFPWHKFLV